ncbi:uncharacterized protein LOC118565098 isoform X1 [Fundulus heteroclitus]|uniref:uncharacterized protein LOC118565098 isoform X1 n=1 Tax=Fundulus heteroclitus TaxID=8078 RepID=UPI00165AD6F9|nr:uncharacterized protein LOC118565098 isoform X1 [Fundulus heteroclitus]
MLPENLSQPEPMSAAAAMTQTSRPPSQQSDVVSLDTLRPAVDFFFTNLSRQQWLHLATGNPDPDTSCVLVELLGDIMELFSSAVLDKLQNPDFTGRVVKAVVGNIVPEAFARALDLEEDIRSKSTANLNKLIVQHVAACVQRHFYSDDEDPAATYIQQVTDMYRINAVVHEATVVIKELIFRVFVPQTETKQEAPVSPPPEDPEEASDGTASPDSHSETDPQADRGDQSASFHTEELTDGGQTASPSARPESVVNRLKRKIRRFFTKYHRRHSAKVFPLNLPEGPEICGATANPTLVHQAKPPQRSGDVPPEHFAPDGRSSPSDEDESVTYVEEFIAEEDSEISSLPDSGPESPSTEVTQNLESEPKFDEITPVEAFVPEDEASEVPSVEDVPADSQASAAVGEEEELTDLRQPEVCPAVAEPTMPRATAPSTGEAEEQAAGGEDEDTKASVSVLVHWLMARAIKASSIRCSPEVLQGVHGRLLGKVWAEVKLQGIHVDLENVLIHGQKIYDGISKKLRCPAEVAGTLLLLEDPVFDKAVVTSFCKHLRKPVEEPSLLARFFSFLGKTTREPEKQAEPQRPTSAASSAGSVASERSELEDNSSGDYAADDEASSDSDCGSMDAFKSDSSAETPEDTAVQPGQRQRKSEKVDQRKMAVKTLISDVIWQLVEKSGQSNAKERSRVICERLFQKLWAGVKGQLDSMSSEKIKGLSKAVLKDLYKMWPENFLVYVDFGRPLFDKTIVSSIEKRLLKSSTFKKILDTTSSNVKKIFDAIQETLKDSAPRFYMVL